MTTALLIVDVQNDFCPGGSLGTAGGDDVARKVARIASANASSGDYARILATQDWHISPGSHFSDHPDFMHSWPVHCVAKTSGAEMRAPIEVADLDEIFRKGQYDDGYSGFKGTAESDGRGLAQYLRDEGIDSLDVCGIATDFCVRATVLSAREEGFAVRVLQDMCAAVNPEGGQKALDEMENAGAELV